jgi:hypothetical protein
MGRLPTLNLWGSSSVGRPSKVTETKRPMPPLALDCFMPAPDVLAWAQAELITENGSLYNPDHQHLIGADLHFMWAPNGYESKMRRVIGLTERVAFRCNAWHRDRQEQQMRSWFGSVPSFLITLDASFCATCSDVNFCALVEHELYHVGQVHDPYGSPMFGLDGKPKLDIRGHDVEEFVGVVRRYGTGDQDSPTSRLVVAAKHGPRVAASNIAGACGTCISCKT